MKKIALECNQIEGRTEVDDVIFNLVANKNPKVGYIPSQSDLQRKYYSRAVEWYRKFGVQNVLYCDVDEEYDETIIEELFSCDVIHLSGGNTYYFLNNLKKRGLTPKLKEFVEKGGVLIGVSAGGIIMSNTIDITTTDDDLGGDQNDIGLTDFTALGLTDFDFFPHYTGEDQEVTRRLQEYSSRVNSIVYACDDGSGLIVNDDDLQFIGQIHKFERGKVSKIEN